MSNAVDDPDELHALAAVAMEHAMRSIQPKGPLLPFALIEGVSGRQLIRSIGDRLEDMVADTRLRLATEQKPARAVLAWDGYSGHTGRRMDTIFVEAYESGADGGILIAQPYQSAGIIKKRNEPVTQAAIVERGRPPLF